MTGARYLAGLHFFAQAAEMMSRISGQSLDIEVEFRASKITSGRTQGCGDIRRPLFLSFLVIQNRKFLPRTTRV